MVGMVRLMEPGPGARAVTDLVRLGIVLVPSGPTASLDGGTVQGPEGLEL